MCVSLNMLMAECERCSLGCKLHTHARTHKRTCAHTHAHICILTVLHVSQCGLSGTLKDIGNLKHMQFFYADSNSLSGPLPESVGELTEMRVLYLRDNKLSGVYVYMCMFVCWWVCVSMRA